MNKTFAILAVAMMMFTAGCGKTAEDVKQDANAAVEQAKDKVDEAKEKVDEKVDAAKEKVDEAKENANNAVNNAVNTAQAVIDDAKNVMAKIKDGTSEKNVFALDGVVPGINVETVTEILGEPTAVDGTNFEFSNGLDMKVVDNVVQEISTKYGGLYTPANIAVGMVETALNTSYGQAVSVSNNADGSVTYKYISSDNRRTLEISTSAGSISEIKCSLNK